MEYHEHQAALRARVDSINKAARGESIKHEIKSGRSLSKPKILEGYAILYDVVHWWNGKQDIFQKGCFDGSLFDVMFLIDHVITSKKLGDQNNGSLELIDTDKGLAFRLKLAPGDLERIDGRSEMSPCYYVHNAETRKDGVRVIKSASLLEVSACHVAAIRQTHAVIRDADAVGAFSEDVKNFAVDSAATGFMRALQRLKS
jgi:HK97 family phage prohead protease